MKKMTVALGLGLACIFCHAENRLFPTDILQQGEVDMRATVAHDTVSTAISFGNNTGMTSSKSTGESVQIRYGLGSNWYVGATLSYASQAVAHTDYDNPVIHYVSRAEGGVNPLLWATYGFINEAAKPFSLNGELLATIKTTNSPSAYTARLLAGWRANDTLKYYGTVSSTTIDSSRRADSHGLTLGAYKDLSENLTVVPHASYTWIDSNGPISSWTQQGFGLSANVRISQNTYLIPNASFYRVGSRHSADGLFHVDSTSNGRNIAISAYHLF